MEQRWLEATYDGRCTLYGYESQRNSNGVTETVKVVKQSNIPCALSQVKTSSAIKGDDVQRVNDTVKLFLSPDVAAKAGAFVEVTQYGRTRTYTLAGEPFIYPSHQEWVLIREDKA